jgi:hypothetical protein
MKGVGLWDFGRALVADWFARMSGPLSVPAAVAALWVADTTARILLGATAFVCLATTGYALWRRERERAPAAETKLEAIAHATPDWPIHELFSYINPDFLERADSGVGDAWDNVSNDIRDQASLRRLKIWGRAVGTGVDRILGQRETFRLIERNYWTMAFFTYSFFNESAGDAPHTYLEAGRRGVVYTDLHVNRAEAQLIWPKNA